MNIVVIGVKNSMIDTRIVNYVSEMLPKMSEDICNGLPEMQMEAGEDYVHQVFKCAMKDLLPGFKYVGFQRCNPYEEFAEITRPHKPKKSFDLAQSDTYMVKYLFTFNGLSLKPRYVQLPYVSDGSLIHLKGTRYEVTPVIKGRVFNIERGMLYLPIPRAKMKFSRISVGMVLNEKIINVDAVHSELYNMPAADRPPNLVSLLTHYILAKYGLTEMMRCFYAVDVRIGGKDLDNLPKDQWYVYKSKKIPIMKTQSLDTVFSELRVAIPAAQYTPELDTVIGAVFYIADVRPEAMNIVDVDNPRLWLSVLPTFLFRRDTLSQKRFNEMVNHLSWLVGYVDELTKIRLAKDNIVIGDIFELFSYIIVNMNDMVANNDVGSLFYQELSTINNVYYDIVHNIFSLMYALKRISLDRLSADKISGVMNDTLRSNRILSITRHGEVNAGSIASDCKPYTTTCKMISHYKASNINGKSSHQTLESDSAKLLHSSQSEVNSLMMMSKADPSSRSALNPFVYLRDGSYICPRPDNQDQLEELNILLSGEFFK